MPYLFENRIAALNNPHNAFIPSPQRKHLLLQYLCYKLICNSFMPILRCKL